MERYKGKYFSVLGDSISTLAGYNPEENEVFYNWKNKALFDVYTPSDTWWGQVIEALGGRLLVNDSWSGSMVCRHPQCEIQSYGCSDSRTGRLGVGEQKPDVIMVLMGLNDFGNGMPLRTKTGEGDLACFSVAYETMLQKLQKNYPDAEIWCMTLPYSRWSKNPDFVAPAIRSGGHIRDYGRVIRECGQKAGCRVIELFHPEAPYDTNDGYHPNCHGMYTLMKQIMAQMV